MNKTYGRPRQNTDTLGGFLDSCKDGTTILLYFDTEDGIWRIPHILGDPPTAGQLKNNPYLRPMAIRERSRFQIAGTSETGWTVRISERFDAGKYLAASEG